MELKQIGVVKHTSRGTVIKIDAPYLKGLVGLGGFGHINVLWWFSNCDNPQSRSIVTLDRPYRNAPETIGVFASRSPERPNPIALTTSEVLGIDYEQGEIFVDFINAEDGSPVSAGNVMRYWRLSSSSRTIISTVTSRKNNSPSSHLMARRTPISP